jgi:hypothetical protein
VTGGISAPLLRLGGDKKMKRYHFLPAFEHAAALAVKTAGQRGHGLMQER